VRGEERVAEEQRRSRDLQARLERERQLELENFTIRYATLDQVSPYRTDVTVDLVAQLGICNYGGKGIRHVAIFEDF
jgi:hypothetical protein